MAGLEHLPAPPTFAEVVTMKSDLSPQPNRDTTQRLKERAKVAFGPVRGRAQRKLRNPTSGSSGSSDPGSGRGGNARALANRRIPGAIFVKPGEDRAKLARSRAQSAYPVARAIDKRVPPSPRRSSSPMLVSKNPRDEGAKH